ncbi:MAG: nickel pincer cofactor biosynthesis protein LarB [Methanomassiliicoccales archaeon]|nr:MAG: nickel pincer cofactor biosynthesis protein LarB [Methanomassiliicoccales archaeon]
MAKGDSRNHHMDILRECRTNIPEVVFARFKDDHGLLETIKSLLEANKRVLVTKCSRSQMELLNNEFASKVKKGDEISGTMIIVEEEIQSEIIGSVAVVSAGTSDYFVAEEAGISSEFFGLKVYRHYDCGIAGIHRVEGALKTIEEKKVDVVIVVAGMEGALPSIISGLVKQPIVAVPTSVGYGASLNGIAALLAMLNSCSPGVVVVNIDNGFGAAAAAYKTIKWMKNRE